MFPEIDRQAILEIVENEEKTDKIMALLEEAAKREKQRRLALQAEGIKRARQKGTTLGRPERFPQHLPALQGQRDYGAARAKALQYERQHLLPGHPRI